MLFLCHSQILRLESMTKQHSKDLAVVRKTSHLVNIFQHISAMDEQNPAPSYASGKRWLTAIGADQLSYGVDIVHPHCFTQQYKGLQHTTSLPL